LKASLGQKCETLLKKGLEVWPKRESVCLASGKLQVQTPELQKKEKKNQILTAIYLW
jgi:hypothetical protein